MPESIDAQGNERAVERPQRAEQSISVGAFELEYMLSLVRNFTREADGFNLVVGPLLENMGGILPQQQTELNNLMGHFVQISQDVISVNAKMRRVLQILGGNVNPTADNPRFQTKVRKAKE